MGKFIKNFFNYFHKRKEDKLKYAARKLIQQVNEENVNKKLHGWRFTEKSSRDHRYRTPFNTPLSGEFAYNLPTINSLSNCSHVTDKEFQKILHVVYLEVFLRLEKGIEETMEKDFQMAKVKSEPSIQCASKSSPQPSLEGTTSSSKGSMPKQAMESRSLHPNATSKDNIIQTESLNHNEIYLPKVLANFSKENNRPTSCPIKNVSENNNADANLSRCRYSTNVKEKRTTGENFNSKPERIILSPSNNGNSKSNEDSTELFIAHRISAGNDADPSEQQESTLKPWSSRKSGLESEVAERESPKRRVQIPKAVATTNLRKSPKNIHAKSMEHYDGDTDSIITHDENARRITSPRISDTSDEDTLDIISVRSYGSRKSSLVAESWSVTPSCYDSRKSSSVVELRSISTTCPCKKPHCCKFSDSSQKPEDSHITNERKRCCGCSNHINRKDELK